MVGILRCCLQSLMKMVNSVMGMTGIGMILYALWMFRVWFRALHELGSHAQAPWFIFTFLGLGVSLCVITCTGHIAADTVNGYCLSCYMFFVSFLLLFEATVTADVFLNSHWEEDLPEDKTGKLEDFKNFIESNFKFCKWIGLGVVAAQGVSIFLAIVLRALGPDQGRYYDSDEEYTSARVPLLKNYAQPRPCVMDPHIHPKTDAWSSRV